MKIAVASENNLVSQHFGHCPYFEIFNISDKEIEDVEIIESPGHKPGLLPKFLNEQGIDLVIAGGMGKGAVDLFEELNIRVITGASGSTRENVEAYLSGNLKSNKVICNEHQHRGECGNH